MPALIPDEISAGLTLDFRVGLTAYPAPEWSLSVILRGPGSLQLDAVPEGTQHRVTASASETAGWLAGHYWYSVRVTDGVTVHEVGEGTAKVKPDLAAVSGPYDGRGHVERVIDSIEAVIQGRASMDQSRYKINGRELERTPVGDLLKLRDQYTEELRRIRAAKAGQTLLGRKILVRF